MALRLNPLLWKSFESLVLAGEAADPEAIWDPEGMEELSRCTGSDPVRDLVNTGGGAGWQGTAPPRPSPQPSDTPQSKASNPLQTPTPAPPRPLLQLNDTSLTSMTGSPVQGGGGLETPLLHYNSISSTPGQGSPAQPLSGLSCLNLTVSDTSTDCISLPPHRLAMPPPLKPKARRPTAARAGSVRAFNSNFGVLGDTPSPAGVAAKLLEFSSPQVLLLQASSPAPPPRLQPLVSTPAPPTSPPNPLPLRTSTPGALPPSEVLEPRPIKRVAMAAKPENTGKPNVVLTPSQSLGNMITPSPVSLPPRRSSRLFGSTQSVKENSKGSGKGRLKSKSRLLQSNRQLSENELNEKNKLADSKAERERLGGQLEPEQKPCRLPQPPGLGAGVNLGAEAEKLQRASLRGLLVLLRQLGAAMLRVGGYDMREAVRLLEALPPRHAASPWVLATLGKCHFELCEYRKSVDYFGQLREVAPHRLELLEFYSTALWHLQVPRGHCSLTRCDAVLTSLSRRRRSSSPPWPSTCRRWTSCPRRYLPMYNIM